MTDLPTLDIQAWNTERFQMSRDVSGWASAYTLSAVTWRLQVRRSLEAAEANLALAAAEITCLKAALAEARAEVRA